MKYIFPYPVDEDSRLASLERYGLMDSGEDEEYDAIARIASAVCGIPISLITFIDENRQYFKSHVGTDFTENLREFSFCTHAIASNEDIMVVPDARADERFVNNPMVTGPTKLVFYAGVPLIGQEGHAFGTICVLDQQTHKLTDGQIAALKSLARQVVDKIELRMQVSKLKVANQDLMNSNILIQKFASMAAHDIKTPLTSMLLTSQVLKSVMEKTGDERSHKMIDIQISSTKKLLVLIDEMLAYSKAPSLLTQKKQKIDIAEQFERLQSLLSIPEGLSVTFETEVEAIMYSGIAIEQILLNLLTNAIRYNDKTEGKIDVKVWETEADYYLSVSDNGKGIAPEYHQQIFEPRFTLSQKDRFDQSGTGIGLSTIKDLLQVLNGEITLDSTPGRGTVFNVRLNKGVQ